MLTTMSVWKCRHSFKENNAPSAATHKYAQRMTQSFQCGVRVLNCIGGRIERNTWGGTVVLDCVSVSIKGRFFCDCNRQATIKTTILSTHFCAFELLDRSVRSRTRNFGMFAHHDQVCLALERERWPKMKWSGRQHHERKQHVPFAETEAFPLLTFDVTAGSYRSLCPSLHPLGGKQKRTVQVAVKIGHWQTKRKELWQFPCFTMCVQTFQRQSYPRTFTDSFEGIKRFLQLFNDGQGCRVFIVFRACAVCTFHLKQWSKSTAFRERRGKKSNWFCQKLRETLAAATKMVLSQNDQQHRHGSYLALLFFRLRDTRANLLHEFFFKCVDSFDHFLAKFWLQMLLISDQRTEKKHNEISLTLQGLLHLCQEHHKWTFSTSHHQGELHAPVAQRDQTVEWDGDNSQDKGFWPQNAFWTVKNVLLFFCVFEKGIFFLFFSSFCRKVVNRLIWKHTTKSHWLPNFAAARKTTGVWLPAGHKSHFRLERLGRNYWLVLHNFAQKTNQMSGALSHCWQSSCSFAQTSVSFWCRDSGFLQETNSRSWLSSHFLQVSLAATWEESPSAFWSLKTTERFDISCGKTKAKAMQQIFEMEWSGFDEGFSSLELMARQIPFIFEVKNSTL